MEFFFNFENQFQFIVNGKERRKISNNEFDHRNKNYTFQHESQKNISCKKKNN